MSVASSSSFTLFPTSCLSRSPTLVDCPTMNGSTSASSSRSTSNSLYNSYGQTGLSGFERRNALIVHADDSPSMTWTPFFESMQDADAGFMSKINGTFGM